MSKENYARGFCKKACDLGWSPVELSKFLKSAKAKYVPPKGNTVKDKIQQDAEEAMRSIADYSKRNPISGGALAGGISTISAGSAGGASVGGSLGGVALSPLSIVTVPAGAAIGASSGDARGGSAVGSAVPAGVGKTVGGSVGGVVGGVAGSAVAPIGAAVGASAGSSVKKVYDEFNQRVAREKALQQIAGGQ